MVDGPLLVRQVVGLNLLGGAIELFLVQGVVSQSDLSSTIIVSRCYNDLSICFYD